MLELRRHLDAHCQAPYVFLIGDPNEVRFRDLEGKDPPMSVKHISCLLSKILLVIFPE